jgi:hypothetical protein
MQKYARQNIQAKISQFRASFIDVFKYWKIALIALVLVGSVGGGLSAYAADITNTDIGVISQVGAKGERLVVQDCAPATGNWGVPPVPIPPPNENTEIGPCEGQNGKILYNCKLAGKSLTTNIDIVGNFTNGVSCQSQMGNETNQNEIIECVKLNGRGWGTWSARVLGSGGNFDKDKCAKIIAPFCAHMLNTTKNRNSGKSLEYCETIGYNDSNKPNVVGVTNSNNTASSVTCKTPSAAQIEEIKTKLSKDFTFEEKNACLDDAGSLFYCLNSTAAGEKSDCVAINKEAKATQQTVGDTGGNSSGSQLGGLFSILYKVVITILLICLILIEYIQMIILTIMAYIISALLDLSPSAPILTKIGLPLWQIFANLANFLVVGFMVYVGASTMIGLRKTDQAGKDVVTIAVLAMLLNTTYFFLNFVISTVDGFARLLITVFVGKGGLFGLFSGLFGLFSKVSVLRDGKGAIDVSSPVSAVGNFGGTLATAAGNIAQNFGKDDNGAALTFTFLGEALVVISFFIILLIFKDTFILVFARVTILLLLLITSPVWVVAYFLKDIFKSSPISAAISKLPSQLFGTIFYNFALVLGIIITVLVTGTAQEGFKNYRLDIGDGAGTIAGGGGADAANFLNPNGASLIIAGVVPVFLGVSILYFINQAFKNLFPLLDQIASQVGKGAADFAKGIISGDVKGGIAKFAKGATTLATGGGQLENVATLAPKLAVKGGVMGLGLAAGTIDNITGLTGNRTRLGQRLANVEDRFVKPFAYKPSEAFSNWAGDRFGENSNENLNARELTKRIRDQQKATRDNRNRGTVADYMNEHNESNMRGFGGRRRLIDGSESKLAADTAEKRMNANQKTIEQEGRQQFIDGNANRIQDAARLDQLANDNEGRVNANLSQQEERGKDDYLSSPEGQEAVRTRVLAEQNLEQLKVITDNLKSGQESTAKVQFNSDPRTEALRERATELKILTGINNQTNESDINKQQAITESIINAEPQVKAAYSRLVDSEFGVSSTVGGVASRSGGSVAAQSRASQALKNAQGDYKTEQRRQAAYKQRKEDVEKEKEKTILLENGRDAIPRIIITSTQRPISTASNGDDLNQITQAQIDALDINDGIAFETYRDALNNWESEDLEFDKAILENINNVNNAPGGVRLPEADALLTSYRQKKTLHALKKPAI